MAGLGFFGALVALNFNLLIDLFMGRKLKGEIRGPNKSLGHRLRNPQTINSSEVAPGIRVETVIIGAGIGGLSAGWWLQRNGYEDYLIFELENHAGGNSSYGKNNHTLYPWGAHYLPVPPPEAVYVKELLKEMKVLKGGSYDKTALCYAPAERLYIYNTWQAGLFPRLGASGKDLDDLERFRSLMRQYGRARGRDGRRAFSIPVALSSRDNQFRSLAKKSMLEFFRENGFSSNRLLWYINNACLDDFGSNIENTSAWVGIHYYASRIDDDRILVWPEGNGYLSSYLQKKSSKQLKTGYLAHQVEKTEKGYRVSFYHDATARRTEVNCRNIIYAAPKFTLPYVYKALDSVRKEQINEMRYSPWMVANLQVARTHEFTEPAWDNVIYKGSGLGYINSDHQQLKMPGALSTFTYYKAYGASDTVGARRQMFSKTHRMACDEVLSDLSIAHEDIESRIQQIDFYYWAHAMVRLDKEYNREKTEALFDNQDAGGCIYFAHSDASGLSIFEEAQYHGVEAAKRVLKG